MSESEGSWRGAGHVVAHVIARLLRCFNAVTTTDQRELPNSCQTHHQRLACEPTYAKQRCPYPKHTSKSLHDPQPAFQAALGPSSSCHAGLHRTALDWPRSTWTLHPICSRHATRATKSLHMRRVAPAWRARLILHAVIYWHIGRVHAGILHGRTCRVHLRASMRHTRTTSQLSMRLIRRLHPHLLHLTLAHQLCVVLLWACGSAIGAVLLLRLRARLAVRIPISTVAAVCHISVALICRLVVVVLRWYVVYWCCWRRVGDASSGVHGILPNL